MSKTCLCALRGMRRGRGGGGLGGRVMPKIYSLLLSRTLSLLSVCHGLISVLAEGAHAL